jgi:hypothetical protein
MSTSKQLIIYLFLIGFSHACAAYNIEESKNRKPKDLIGKSKKKKETPPKKVFNGYEVRNEKGERVGYVSRNQRCSVVMNLNEGKPSPDSATMNNNIDHLNLKCGGSRK